MSLRARPFIPSKLWTGYYGVPGKIGSMVHLSLGHHMGPLCGAAISKKAEFQWCTPYPALEYVECKRCRKTYANGLRAMADRVEGKL